MIFRKVSRGCAPTSIMPLMKKTGVARAPRERPAIVSSFTFWAYFPESRHRSKDSTSSPTSLAYPLSLPFVRPKGPLKAKSTSWYSQNFPCSPAQSAAWADVTDCLPRMARWPYTNRTLPAFTYSASRLGSVSLQNFAQKTHWKSESSMIVTGALSEPKAGPLARRAKTSSCP